MDQKMSKIDLTSDNVESNKSTPYYTPLSTLSDGCNRFEFPMPLASHSKFCSSLEFLSSVSTVNSPTNSKITNEGNILSVTTTITVDPIRSTTRRLRRSSLYERRSCSPQNLQTSNLLHNRSLCKSDIDTYEQANNNVNSFLTPIHSAVSTTALNSSSAYTPLLVDISSRQIYFDMQSSYHSPKMYDQFAIDIDCDKENEVPPKTECFSPKSKAVDQILFQQNSPRTLENDSVTAATSVNQSDIIYSASNYASTRSSPLSSAGYLSGEYFKFPEVDALSPGVNKKTDSGHYDNCKKELVAGKSQIKNEMTRRSRLKSISLDSECAKSVDVNWGKKILENTFKINDNQSQSKNNLNEDSHNAQCKTNFTPITKERDVQKAKTFRNQYNIEYTGSSTHFSSYEWNSDRKDFHNSNISAENYCNIMNYQTREPETIIENPKSPALGLIKQKAISLDSSDSKYSKLECYKGKGDESVGGAGVEHRLLAVSLYHIPSMSKPDSPKKQLPIRKAATEQNRHEIVKENQMSKGRRLGNYKPLTPSTSASTFDYNKCLERQGFILKLDSFNENMVETIDYLEESNADEEFVDNYFLNFDENIEIAGADEVNFSTTNFPHSEDSKKISVNVNKVNVDLLSQKCSTVLNVSNNNLKTLPEIMTLSDFSNCSLNNTLLPEKELSNIPLLPQKHMTTSSGRSPRSSLLQRRGSNHSLTLNLDGSNNSLCKGLSTSNYSLGSNISQNNLSSSIYNLTHQSGQLKANQGLFLKGTLVGMPSFVQNTCVINGTGGNSNVSTVNHVEKKKLLQRRGSNTSLTLNVHNSPYANLNRFNSHSSLNTMPQQQQNSLKMHYHFKETISFQNDNIEQVKTKKGLLERRGSNASLTINLNNNALGISNLNLRSSVCSLSSINTTQLEEEYESNDLQGIAYDLNIRDYNRTVGHQRKFYSSENLNSLNTMTQHSKLNQAHVRNSSKTCFGSVSDLKPFCQLPLPLIIGEEGEEVHFGKDFSQTRDILSIPKIGHNLSKDINIPLSYIPKFKRSNLCSCTGVRNITTRPLSPQTTSEDFKIYLANIQLLQNASNILNEYDLIKLNYTFNKIYGNEGFPENFEQNQSNFFLLSDYQFELPAFDEQKRLLRNLHQEFWDLPTNHQEKPMVFGSQSKNRYRSILPNEHSRVQLLPEDGCFESGYINANFVKGPDYVRKSYIATQGPLPNTIYDFWLMVFQNICRYEEQKLCQPAAAYTNDIYRKHVNVLPPGSTSSFRAELKNNSLANLIGDKQKIIMLTNFVENNRQKCSTYFPINENEIFLITYTNDQIRNPHINIFYNKYFEHFKSKQTVLNIETFQVEISDTNLISHLPKVNYFVIKNSKVIIKKGFSMRQLDCLFCCNIASKNVFNELNNGDVAVENRIQILHKFCSFHYWYPDWPDHRSPNDVDVLLEISRHLLTIGKCESEFFYGVQKENDYFHPKYCNNQPLPIIHCSAGIGRTGCMAAILNGICQIQDSLLKTPTNQTMLSSDYVLNEVPINKTNNCNNCMIQTSSISGNYLDNLQRYSSHVLTISSHSNISPKNHKNECVSDLKSINLKNKKQTKINPHIYVDILGIVCNLRLQRGGMVQNSEQYELIHRAMCLYLKTLLECTYETHL